MDPRLKMIIKGKPEQEVKLLLRLQNADTPKLPYAKIISKFGDVVSIRVKRKQIPLLYQSDLVFSLKAPKVLPVNDHLNHHEVYHKPLNFTKSTSNKSNVVFGIIDFGIDFTHQDFINNNQSAIESVWYQNAKTNQKNKYGYGKILSNQALNDAILTEKPFETIAHNPCRSDLFGTGTHGTHVLGIACSNGKISKKGYAHDANIIAVDMGNSLMNGSDVSLGDSVKLIEAIDFIIKTAKNRPVVINMSLGGHGDSHTGKTLVEIAMDNLLLQRKGTAIIQSTGNYYKAKAHTNGKLIKNTNTSFKWMFKKRDLSPNELELWYAKEDKIALRLEDEFGNILLENKPFEDNFVKFNNKNIGVCFHRFNEPNCNLNHVNIVLNGAGTVNYLHIILTPIEINHGAFHCYIERDDRGQSYLEPEIVTTNFTTNTICNGNYTIAVGAQNQFTDNNVMFFSSSGPTLDGRMKPELIAPGNKIISSCSASAREFRASQRLTSKSGSSMAAPLVASLVYLILKKQPKISIQELRALVFKNCMKIKNKKIKDLFRVGYGKINEKKLINHLNQT
jgi:subtilisin family serine protease